MVLGILYKFLIFPGFVFTAFLGLILSWADRKISARLQYRIGPRPYQPFVDILKLLGKENMIPDGANKGLFILSPMIGLAGIMLVSTVLWVVNMERGATFIGDLIVVYYLLLLPSLALILGGFSSRSPYATLGASREIKLILAYELPFIIALFTPVARAGSLLFGDILKYQALNGMIAGHVSGTIAFVIVILAFQAKLGYPPFDIAEAEQEIAGGPLVEYSGRLLAVFKLTKAMMLATLPLLAITIFLGGIDLASPAGIGWFVLKYSGIILLFSLIKNTNPRLRIDQAVRFFWGPATALAIVAFILNMLGA